MSMLARSKTRGTVIVERFFTLEKTDMELVVAFEQGFNYDDFTKAVDYIKNYTDDNWYSYNKPICYYRKPSPVFYRNKTFIKTEFQCSFFYSNGRLAYTPTGTTGYYISDMSYERVERIVVRHKDHPEIVKKKEIEKEKLWKRIDKARYKDSWNHLSKDDFNQDSHPFVKIDKILSRRDIQQITKAFENKERFTFKVEKTKRQYTVEGKLGDDGIYRAWFSSEFIGECHGDYYYLLNPTTAVFCEHD